MKEIIPPVPVWQHLPTHQYWGRRVTDQKEQFTPLPNQKSGNLLPLPIDSEGGHCD